MSVSLTYATVDATRSIPELYAPAGGRPPSLAIQGEDLATLNQRPQATAAGPPSPKVLTGTGTGAAGPAPAAAGHDIMTSLSAPSVQPSAAAASGRDVQLGVNFDTLA